MEKSKYIDHTNLKATATYDDILKLCNEANLYHFACVCVNPSNVGLAHKLLTDTGVLTCTVVGFPLGATPSEVKAFETTKAIADGADEIDMVINIGMAKAHNWEYVYEDIKAVVEAARGVLVKVIIECCYLTDEEKVEACKAAMRAHADFVKTSTGFGTGGATVEDVVLMKKTVGTTCKVKAAGGIRNKASFEAMIDAGADRIGCSCGTTIMEEYKNE
ncbi:MAG: deoxyribose-phosphate aldolase [Roseburia sp.]|nr:deoxyribose-phosphate aldolase [Anaeroplasma bactoclasticum]MCM1196118.1 deoxyribose-phosphate aldolase [Roseburia sp.]MCM1556000.1 deoxyribose-phosphate aldolase [Anaeroplasma bactoclasticum]